MRNSIRTRLFLGSFSLVIFFVLLSWALNNGYLKKFYLDRKEQRLVESYHQIDQIYTGDPQRIELQLEKIARTSGIAIRIFNNNCEEKYNSFPKHYDSKNKERQLAPSPARSKFHTLPPRVNKHLLRIQSKLAGLRDGKYEIGIIKEPRLDMAFVNLGVRLKNKDYLWLETPVIEIEESARIANQFFLITGLLVLLVGSLLAYLYAKNFTRPILELNGIARRIAKLDFSQKYHGSGNLKNGDELDELGQSINILSEELGQLIGQLQETNRKLAEEVAQRQKIDEMRKEFIYNVSHELKTPLALIQGYAEGLTQNVIANEEDKAFYCGVIMDEAIKMNSLVKELLDLSQIESGTTELETEEFDLSELIEQVLEKYRLRFKEQNVRIDFEKTGQSTVRADYFRIEQVLYNYLDNALHHLDHRKVLRIYINGGPNKVRASVYNSGKPIPQEYCEAIWQSFYKADKARTRAYGGSGLGLSIVKAIMELHHNECGLVNHDDGVEFWFELDSVSGKPVTAEAG